MADDTETRIALIGAGTCARTRLDLWLAMQRVRVVAIVSSDLAAAERLAALAPGARAFATAYEMLKVGGVDLVHVLGPLSERARVARTVLESGVSCLCGNPPGAPPAQVEELYELAERGCASFGVEASWRSHPRVRALAQDLVSGRLGKLESLQLLVRLAEHWPGSESDRARLIEGAAEPLLLANDLVGPLEMRAVSGEPEGTPRALAFAGQGEHGSAQVGVVIGGSGGEAMLTAVCRDGVVQIDLVRDVVTHETASRGSLLGDLKHAIFALARRRWASLRPGPVRLGLARGIATSLADAVAALRERRPFWPGARSVVATARALDAAGATAVLAPAPGYVPPPPLAARPGEIVVIGQPDGVGRALVTLLLDKGQPATLFVPHAGTLPDELRDPRLRIVTGVATDARAAEKALAGAAYVVVLGTAPLGATPDAAVQAVALLAFARHVTRFVLVSSVATLPIGAPVVLRGDSDTDIRAADRSPEVRAWVAAEQALRSHARHVGLDAVVLRPGLVVGTGCPREHPWLGSWNEGSTCTGYGMGQHPLPFVLASDVARAIVAALFTQGIAGRAYNLAGDVVLSAHEYVEALGRRMERGYRFRPRPLLAAGGVAAARELVALALARRSDEPTGHELRSRAFLARLDCSDAKRDLGWWPCTDRARFLAEAIPEDPPVTR